MTTGTLKRRRNESGNDMWDLLSEEITGWMALKRRAVPAAGWKGFSALTGRLAHGRWSRAASAQNRSARWPAWTYRTGRSILARCGARPLGRPARTARQIGRA